MISVGVKRGRVAFEDIAQEWESLVKDSFTSVFSSPAWYLASLDAFPYRNLAVITARDGGRLVGVLPLARFRTDFRGLYFPQLAPLARGDYQPPVVDSDLASEVLPLMLDKAFDYFGRRGVLWWPNVPATDPS